MRFRLSSGVAPLLPLVLGLLTVTCSVVAHPGPAAAAPPVPPVPDKKPPIKPPAPDARFHWIDTWTNMPQQVEDSNLPPVPFINANVSTFFNTTLRQTLHMSVGAQKIRIVFSNTFGGSDLPITSAELARPANGNAGASAIAFSPGPKGKAAGGVPVTFNNGKKSVVVPPGQTVTSDTLEFPVKNQEVIALDIYLKDGQAGTVIDGHPGSRTTTWLVAGDDVGKQDVNSTGSGAMGIAHWYLLGSVQAWVPVTERSFIVLGDSITDGRGSDTDKNNRWPDLLLARMQSSGLTNIAVCNEAAGGNRILQFGLGPSLLTRYHRDALQQPGVKWVMIFEGVNDIGTAATDVASQQAVGDQLIAAYKQIAGDVKKAGFKVFGATITPFSAPGGAAQQPYSDPVREQTRLRMNDFIMHSGTFDAVVDFATMLADPAVPSQLKDEFNSGDFLHPNVAGYTRLAEGFPLHIFT